MLFRSHGGLLCGSRGSRLLYACSVDAGGWTGRRSELFPGRGSLGRGLAIRGASAAAKSMRALSNTRLKLAAAGVYGRIAFVNSHVRRRSLGAIR